MKMQQYHESKTIDAQQLGQSVFNSIEEKLKSFNSEFAMIIKPSLNGLSVVDDSIRKIAEIRKAYNKPMEDLASAFKTQLEQYNNSAKMLAEALKPQINIWQTWANRNNDVFKEINNYWVKFQNDYHIAEKQAVRILRKHKWFVTPSFPAHFIFKIIKHDHSAGEQDIFIDQLFINFFQANNWRNLTVIVNSWKKNKLLFKRYNILSDCLKVIKSEPTRKINSIVNVVLPTLITQIDGALSDYLDLQGIAYGCSYDDGKRNGKIIVGRKSGFKNKKFKPLTPEFEDLVNDVFLNILFQRTQIGKPLSTPFNFNRHKIIHGEDTNYGKVDYLIRAFMFLDYLSYIK